MDFLTLVVLKKNRKYFAAEHNGYKCKILIDENSESLELGEHSLLVEDISVSSKYGKNWVYKLSGNAEEQKNSDVCILKTERYNSKMVEQCRAYGGKWDAVEKCWSFSSMIEEVEVLDEKYNSENIVVELTFKEEVPVYRSRYGVEFRGFSIVTSNNRDDHKMAKNVALISGDVAGRCEWATGYMGVVIKQGAVIRMGIPKLCINDDEIDDRIEMKIIDKKVA